MTRGVEARNIVTIGDNSGVAIRKWQIKTTEGRVVATEEQRFERTAPAGELAQHRSRVVETAPRVVRSSLHENPCRFIGTGKILRIEHSRFDGERDDRRLVAMFRDFPLQPGARDDPSIGMSVALHDSCSI